MGARQPGQKTTPKCVSSAKRASMSKSERLSAQRRKRAADPGQPQKTGAAKPTYVSTDKPKKKMSESTQSTWVPLEIEIPNNIRDFNLGLMFRESLDVNSGMLFVFEEVGQQSFHMTETRIPLDIAFIREDGTIESIKELEPYDENPVASDGEVLCALEVNRGWFAENNVEVGDQIDIEEGKKDACYHKVKSRYSVWPSAYASGALVKCRKVGAANWGNKTKKEGFSPMQVAALEAAGMIELNEAGKKCWKGYEKKGTKMMFGKRYNNCVKKEEVEFDEGMMDTVKDVGKKVIKKTKEFINKPIIAPTINQKDYQQRVKDKTTHKLVGEGSSYGITRGSGVPSGQMAAFGKKKKDKDKKKAQVEEGITFLKRKKKESSSEYTRERDAGKEAKKVMKKKDQEKVNFLEPEETNESKTRLVKKRTYL